MNTSRAEISTARTRTQLTEMATLDISKAIFSLLPPISRVQLSSFSPPSVFATSSQHALSLSLTLPHLHRNRTLPPFISRYTNAQVSDDGQSSGSEEFLEEEDEVDDSDGGADYDDSLDVDALEEEAKHAVREYSRSLSRQLSLGKLRFL